MQQSLRALQSLLTQVWTKGAARQSRLCWEANSLGNGANNSCLYSLHLPFASVITIWWLCKFHGRFSFRGHDGIEELRLILHKRKHPQPQRLIRTHALKQGLPSMQKGAGTQTPHSRAGCSSVSPVR